MSEIHEYAKDDVVVMLLGNKCDMTSERCVKREEAEKLAKVNNMAAGRNRCEDKNQNIKSIQTNQIAYLRSEEKQIVEQGT